ncbi:STAS domain-containing protein [Mangrovihabitans endophyticus]|uniref:STAS domain-containing protein n=1 Tax=Mangrovihabitans endophyticus TaxID=1751298 RepID=A0A8J3C280_9ACTN|nr:STAS domain-containing protein [Mangrovihabitans endophyticus]GGL08260.1 hypothetical protein GCM10012284_48470 [Mangrovihabitans endophyticus]
MTDSRCAIRRGTGGTRSTSYLRLAGRFDRGARQELQRALRDVQERARARTLMVDVSEVDFIGRECMALLLHAYTRAIRRGHGYEITGAHGHVRRVLEATGLCARADDVIYAPVWREAVDVAALFHGDDMPESMPGDSGRGQLAGEGGGGVIQEDRDTMIIAEMARRGEGAEVDGIDVAHILQIQDQPQRPDVANGVNQGAAQLDRVAVVQDAVRLDDERAIGAGLHVDRAAGHRAAFRYPLFSGLSG